MVRILLIIFEGGLERAVVRVAGNASCAGVTPIEG